MSASIDQGQIKSLLKVHQAKMKRYLSHCMHCSLCAESCFLFVKNDKDPQFMPSYKVLNSVGKLYRKNGQVDLAFLEQIKPIVWKNCVLCGRCYCPVGVDVPAMIAFARSVCRSQGVYPDDEQSWL
jgi:Fe-S oxidoreductase